MGLGPEQLTLLEQYAEQLRQSDGVVRQPEIAVVEQLSKRIAWLEARLAASLAF